MKISFSFAEADDIEDRNRGIKWQTKHLFIKRESLNP